MIALFQILVDLFEKNIDILLDAKRYADLDLLLRTTKKRFQGLARPLCHELPQCIFDGCFRQTIPLDIGKALHKGFRALDLLMQDLRDDHILQDMENRTVIFRIVKWAIKSFAFSPAHQAFGVDLHQQGITIFKPGKARLKRMLEWIQYTNNIDAVNSHDCASPYNHCG